MIRTCSLGLVVVIALTSSARSICIGQDDLLPDLGVDMSLRGPGRPHVPLTPGGITKHQLLTPEEFNVLYLTPLRWELEKHQIYRELSEGQIEEIKRRVEDAAAARGDLLQELDKTGLATPTQLESVSVLLQQADLDLAVQKAEMAALRSAIERREKSAEKKVITSLDKAIQLQKDLIAIVEKSNAESEILPLRKDLALMEAESERQPDAILDALLSRLAEVQPQMEATAAKIQELRKLEATATHVRQLMQKIDSKEKEIQSLTARREELHSERLKQRLHMEYLEEIISRYESALEAMQRQNEKEQNG